MSHDEFSRVEAIRGQRTSSTLTPPARRRAAVAEGSRRQPGIWIDVDTLFRSCGRRPRAHGGQEPARPVGLYLVDSRYGSLGPACGAAWYVLEGRYALCVLFEYAATLGVIDVAYTGPRGAGDDYRELWGADRYDSLSRYDGLAAVRVNDLGAAILHDPSACPPSASRSPGGKVSSVGHAEALPPVGRLLDLVHEGLGVVMRQGGIVQVAAREIRPACPPRPLPCG